MTHDFQERLEYSAQLSDEPSWEAFYRSIWPDMMECVRVDGDCPQQRAGVDRIVVLPARQILVDEKKRSRDYGDIALEVWSVWHGRGDRRNRPGWAVDSHKVCDYVAYAIIPAERCYLLPYQVLRKTVRDNYQRWKHTELPPAKNPGYVTRNFAVPWPELLAAMGKTMAQGFGRLAHG